MTSLHPTPTRLALLQAVDDGEVWEHYPMLPDPSYSTWKPSDSRLSSRVTARIEELRRAGWVSLLRRSEGAHWKAPRQWDLTDAGRSVLQAGRGGGR